MEPRASYIICCVPRTGSWLLSETLQSTGIAGQPREFFDPVNRERFVRSWGISPESDYTEFFYRVVKEATTANGVFGVKVHWYQFEDLLSRLQSLPQFKGVPVHCLMARVLPNLQYVHLTRRDKVRHAVSYARASQTKIWWELEASHNQGKRVLARTPQFNAAALDHMFQLIREHERCWRRYFRKCGVTPFQVFYEDLSQDCVGTVREVIKCLGIPVFRNDVIKTPRLRRQADDLSELWVRQYRLIRSARRTESAGV